MTYRRVIPRDLFNEADLLKCLGRLYIDGGDRVEFEEFRVFDDEGNLSAELVTLIR